MNDSKLSIIFGSWLRGRPSCELGRIVLPTFDLLLATLLIVLTIAIIFIPEGFATPVLDIFHMVDFILIIIWVPGRWLASESGCRR